jgi:hypothetical protein
VHACQTWFEAADADPRRPRGRLPAFERLIGLYVAERAADETATAFCARIELVRVKELLADLEMA